MPEVSHAPSQGNAIRCSRSLKRICLTSAGHNWPGWSCGCAGLSLAGSACQNAVAAALSTKGNWDNLRQRLREWLYDGGDRARPCQTELDVSLCFAPLLRWVLTWWCSDRLALAVDPTLKGDDTTAIVISVVYRGCAIPVAWRILHAQQTWGQDGPDSGTAAGPGPGGPRRHDRDCAVATGDWPVRNCGNRYSLRAGIPT